METSNNGNKNISEKNAKRISKALNELIEAHNKSKKIAQEKLHEIYERLTTQINKVGSELEGEIHSRDQPPPSHSQ